ncbi:uncharacterized protein LOC115044185 [Echeneis naucrates]|uniref:uncharacterized protein LOC115044185 n=1 Tax=Echeneis naucrates TaxID=173247 RepID=UPI0011137C21|nr:uncharacterized protein LOC115044185 [Echeneis naucrates]
MFDNFTEMMITACFSLHRKPARLQRAVGAVRSGSSYRPVPLLTAAPVCALIDEQIHIEGSFLPPHCPVTVCAQIHSEDGDLWEAFTHYNTNVEGTINCKDQAIGGSYLVCEPMGLFWGLQPAPGGRQGLRQVIKTSSQSHRHYMSLLEGHVSSSDGQNTELATSAYSLLRDPCQVCAERTGIVGLSYGVYLTLRIATQTDAKPSCLICISGSVGISMKYSDAMGEDDLSYATHAAAWEDAWKKILDYMENNLRR